MLQKRMFKVLGIVPKANGTSYWTRIGTGWLNRDNSINLKMDYYPAQGIDIQVREMTEDDLRKRERPEDELRGAPAIPRMVPPAIDAPAH